MRGARAVPLPLLLLAACQLPPPLPEERPRLDAFRHPGAEARFLALSDPGLPAGERLAGLQALLAEDRGNLAVAWAVADLGREPGLAAGAAAALEGLASPLRECALARLEAAEERRESLLQEALAKDRDFYPALYLLGRLRLEQGRLAEAGTALSRCLAVVPEWPPALFEMARLCQMEGRPEEAARLLAAYLDVRPRDREVRLLRARLLLQPVGDLRAAAREIERLKSLWPGDPEAALLEAGLAASRGAAAEAAALYEALLEVPPVCGQAAFNLGLLRLRRLDDPAGAAEAFRLFLEAPQGSSAADLFDRFRARVWLLELREAGQAASRPVRDGDA